MSYFPNSRVHFIKDEEDDNLVEGGDPKNMPSFLAEGDLDLDEDEEITV